MVDIGLDRSWNNYERGVFDGMDIHIIPGNENSLTKIHLNIEVNVKLPKGKPKQRFPDRLGGYLRACQLHPLLCPLVQESAR